MHSLQLCPYRCLSVKTSSLPAQKIFSLRFYGATIFQVNRAFKLLTFAHLWKGTNASLEIAWTLQFHPGVEMQEKHSQHSGKCWGLGRKRQGPCSSFSMARRLGSEVLFSDSPMQRIWQSCSGDAEPRSGPFWRRHTTINLCVCVCVFLSGCRALAVDPPVCLSKRSGFATAFRLSASARACERRT